MQDYNKTHQKSSGIPAVSSDGTIPFFYNQISTARRGFYCRRNAASDDRRCICGHGSLQNACKKQLDPVFTSCRSSNMFLAERICRSDKIHTGNPDAAGGPWMDVLFSDAWSW